MRSSSFALGIFTKRLTKMRTRGEALDLVLTSRPQGKNQRTPMAGVPHHAAEGYIARLIAQGYKVALCEQVGSEPVNGLMPREVVRVFTAGTVIEPGMLDAGRNNYLVGVVRDGDEIGLAYADITTGEFSTTQFHGRRTLREELARLAPAELLVPDSEQSLNDQAKAISRYPDWRFRTGQRRADLAAPFSSLHPFRLRLRGQTDGDPRRRRRAGLFAGNAARRRRANPAAGHLQRRRAYGAGQGDAAQSGTDRIPGGGTARFAARRAR
jgi:hypothetical protein